MFEKAQEIRASYKFNYESIEKLERGTSRKGTNPCRSKNSKTHPPERDIIATGICYCNDIAKLSHKKCLLGYKLTQSPEKIINLILRNIQFSVSII